MTPPVAPRQPSLKAPAVQLVLVTVACWVVLAAAYVRGAATLLALALPLVAILSLLLVTVGLATVASLITPRSRETPPVNRHLQATGRQCETCGYDLWATPDRCPECGCEPRWDSLATDGARPAGPDETENCSRD